MRLLRCATVALTVTGAGLIALASCSSSSSGVEDHADAGSDTGRNVPGRDSGDDHTNGDASTDAGPYTEDPGIFVGKWHALSGMPSYCDVRVSDEPQKLASKWLPCPSGRTGCRKLDTSWAKALSGPTRQLVDVSKGPEPTRLVNGKAHFMITRFWHSEHLGTASRHPVGYMHVLEPLDEAPVLAIASGPIGVIDDVARFCTGELGFGDYGVAFHYQTTDPRLPPAQPNGSDSSLIGWAPWGSPTAFTTTIVDVTKLGLASKNGYFVDPVLGDASIWFSTRAPFSVAIFEIGAQSAHLLNGNLSSEYPTPAPGGAFAFDTNEFAITFAKDDGSYTRVVTPTSPQVVTWKALDRSNANALVWVESDYGANYKNATLWTAPFATSEASLVRRKVTKLEDSTFSGGGGGVANKGVFLSMRGRNEATITRLSDGAQWIIVGEPGERFTAPVWVDDDEAILQIAPDPNGVRNDPTYGVVRIARSTLGPPTLPAGP